MGSHKKVVIIILLVRFYILYAQSPDTMWTRIYGGNEDYWGYSVQQTTDGGYIVAGATTAGVGDHAYLVKTDSLGDTLWTKTLGIGYYNGSYSIQQTTDGGYIFAGYTASYGPMGYDVLLIKTNTLGDTLWTKIYGDTNTEIGHCVQQTTEGGYIISGKRNGNIYLINTDEKGDTLWTKTFGGGSGYDCGYSVQQTSDGGYIVVGERLIKTNSAGDSLWAKSCGGARCRCYSVQQTTDGGYIVAGEIHSSGSEDDVYLVKTDSLGDTLWTKTYGDTDIDQGNSVQQTSDGGYIVTGYIRSYSTNSWDAYLVKTDSLGDTLWTKTFGGNGFDEGKSVRQTSDDSYIIVGTTESYATEGYDIYLIKLKPEGSGIEEEINTGLFSLFPATPNPFTTKTTVRYELERTVDVNVSVYNMLGQKVRDLYSGKQSSGVYEVTWNGSANSGEKLSSGIYFVRVKVEEKEASRKLMFVR